jgi:hypothetical protein
MTPRAFLILLAILILGAAVVIIGEDFLAGSFDKGAQNDLASELGITKQGKQRPTD